MLQFLAMQYTSGLLGEALRCRRGRGYYRDSNRLADPERNWRFANDSDSDRKALGQSDPIYGLVDRRKQACRRSARTVLHEDAPGDAVDFSFKGLIMVTH